MTDKSIRISGGRIEKPDPYSTIVYAPTAVYEANTMPAFVHSGALDPDSSVKGGALLVHKDRNPDTEGVTTCVKCGKGRDIVVVINFPGGDGFPLIFCRDCMHNRPMGRPLIIDFKS